jgi:acetyl esterase/lipase
LRTEKDVPYVKDGHERQKLDVYAPVGAKDAPVVVWIHGGGWKRGDKALPPAKVNSFAERGLITVSLTYRFVPEVTIPEMMTDVAKAIRWVRDHAKDYGGNPDKLIVFGHSAGAHLAALVCTDEKYLKAEGVPLASIKGCVPIDVGAFDIPARMKVADDRITGIFKETFGDTAEKQAAVSPIAFVAKDKSIPAFLILHVADRDDTKAQAHLFADKLREAGIDATVYAAEGKTHGTISSDIGVPDDPVTKAVDAFVEKVRK